ncbi:MAG TPA: hypothetical protein ENK57_20605 [Polyangiaceae bacterium]|nr:hypothetical protein [Polyangiaceae bacterium]
MADPTELANKARATLSKALQAIQAAPDVPEALMEIAEPIATTMGVLHRVTKGTATKDEVQGALDTIRQTLDTLQGLNVDHDAIDDAMEGVAGSLSKLFALARAMPADPPPKPATPANPPSATTTAKPVAAPKSAGTGTVRIEKDEVPVPADAPSTEPVTVPRPASAPPRPASAKPIQPMPTVPIQQVDGAPTPAPQPQAQVVAAPQPQAAQVAQQAQPQLQGFSSPAPSDQPPVASPPQRVPGQTDAPVPSDGAKRIEVELGAYSGSNFYKGLSGNDVIDHGGIFVATYQVPKVGAPVALRILLPGDLEFEGDAIVQWTREVRDEGSEPGFGAKFTRISQEGRQLVYRYVRNREPMFYDDM